MGDPKQDKELLIQLESAMTGLWNASVDMDAVAEECKVKKGESLYDRIGKCEASVKEWERDLASLKSDLVVLKKMLDGYPTKFGQEPSGLAQVSYQVVSGGHDKMSASLKKYRKELDAHKQTLRKIKV